MTQPRGSRSALLVLSGAFNPIHTQHVVMLEVTRAECLRLGWRVIAGYLAPSSDEYVRDKLGSDAWPLEKRVELCELAVDGSDWLRVWPTGALSGHRAGREIRAATPGCDDGPIVVEIMGSDAAIRVLEKIAAEWHDENPDGGEPWYPDRVVCCLVRPGPDDHQHLARLRARTLPLIAPTGIHVWLVESEALEPVSSAGIRALVAARHWDTLRASGWLSPQVLQRLLLEGRVRE